MFKIWVKARSLGFRKTVILLNYLIAFLQKILIKMFCIISRKFVTRLIDKYQFLFQMLSNYFTCFVIPPHHPKNEFLFHRVVSVSGIAFVVPYF